MFYFVSNTYKIYQDVSVQIYLYKCVSELQCSFFMSAKVVRDGSGGNAVFHVSFSCDGSSRLMDWVVTILVYKSPIAA